MSSKSVDDEHCYVCGERLPNEDTACCWNGYCSDECLDADYPEEQHYPYIGSPDDTQPFFS